MNSPFRRLKTRVLHPFLFATWFVLDGYAKLGGYHEMADLILWLAVVNLIALSFWLALQYFIADKTKAGLILSLSILQICFYTEIWRLTSIGDFLNRSHVILTVTLVTLFAIAVVRITKSVRSFAGLTSCLNIFSLLLIGFALRSIVFHPSSSVDQNSPPSKEPSVMLSQIATSDVSEGPDIYYIIFDSYTSSESLRKYWGYDNDEFIRHIEAKGFFVAGQSNSNYIWTLPSVASILNLRYLVEYDTLPPHSLPWLFRHFEMIDNNAVTVFLSSSGYEFINLSPFDICGTKRFYAGNLGHGDVGFGRFLFDRTWLGIVVARISNRESFRESNLRIIERLKQLPSEERTRPFFVYAHLMMPHGPFYFDRDGNTTPPENHWGKLSTHNKPYYLEQLIFSNRQIMDIVDTLLTKSNRKPIIIVQGDHGYRFLPGKEGFEESATILNAYHLPNGGTSQLYGSISPVNSFRIIFNYYFKTEFSSLPDMTFISDTTLVVE